MKGQISRMVEGRVLKDIQKSGQFILIRYMDGTSHKIGWKDDKGRLLKGEPVMLNEGSHITVGPNRIRGVYKARNGILLPAGL